LNGGGATHASPVPSQKKIFQNKIIKAEKEVITASFNKTLFKRSDPKLLIVPEFKSYFPC